MNGVLPRSFSRLAVPNTSHQILQTTSGRSMMFPLAITYTIGRLCTEDPISVSRKFSMKFHSFFQTVLMKGEILGTVDHFYWKKEYQACGAPHYHALLWIKDAPVIGQDDVLSWIQEI